MGLHIAGKAADIINENNAITLIKLEDRFGRKAIDMCVYTINEDIFRTVMERTYQGEILELDFDNSGPVVPFRTD